jgi:5'-methylthioadenosine nucleosidase
MKPCKKYILLIYRSHKNQKLSLTSTNVSNTRVKIHLLVQKMNFSLAVLCALQLEADPIINSLDMHEHDDVFDQRLRFRFFISSKRPNICLVLFGKCPKNSVDRIGTQIATLAAWETIRLLKPKIIASVGTAGGFKKKGAQIGEVYISEENICFHGRHIPVPEYKSFEIGSFPSLKINTNGKIKGGVISSGDSVPVSDSDHIKMTTLKTDAKDMEAAAVAEVAYLADTPMFALKAISDFVDSSEHTHQQFMANHKIATTSLVKALEHIISNNYIG